MGTLYRYREQGVTSLIVVLFSTLLFVVVAVGFMQLMTAEQRASADDELSRGAYDSALSGVEDGKRVLRACMDGGDSSDACVKIKAGNCDTVSATGLVTPKDGEVYLKSSSSSGVDGLAGQDFQQAYTCVKVVRDTKDYVKDVSGDNSTIIPLRTVGQFDTVDINWFVRSNSTSDNVELGQLIDSSTTLLEKPNWDPSRPPILRVQLMQYKNGSIDLDSLDNDNGHTVYLYPKASVSSPFEFSLVDPRRSGTLTPTMVGCSSTFISTYACQATLTLPVPTGGTASERVAYLRVTPIYNNAEISVSTRNGVNAVLFHDLQPSIDSTGRAGDVYRRVDARVELDDPNVVYPRATVDITNSLCKVLSVTDSITTYDPGVCN